MNIHKKILHHSKKFFDKAKKKISNNADTTEKNQKFSISQILKEKEAGSTVTAAISTMSAVKVIAIIFGVILLGAFLNKTAEILTSFFLALFFSASIFPGVYALEKRRVPRGLSIAIVIFAVLGVFIFLISNLLPALVNSAKDFFDWGFKILEQVYLGNFDALPAFLKQFGEHIQGGLFKLEEYLKSVQTDENTQKGLLDMVGNNISDWKDLIFATIGGILSFLSSLMLMLILSFFILMDREGLKSFFLSFFSPKIQDYVSKKSDQMQVKITEWIHGQMILFLFMGGVTWLVLSALGVEYALTLGFLTGIAEFVPYLGPLMAFLISTPIAFASGTDTGIYVMIFFAILQVVEGNFLVPMVMDKTVGVPPIVTILAMLVGFAFLEVIGAIIAIPIASIITLFVLDIQKKEHDIFEEKEREQEEEQELEEELKEEFEKFEEWEEKKAQKLQKINRKNK